ncbi:MAG: GH25 family lysozyme [Crocinitomicaceae bacterium]
MKRKFKFTALISGLMIVFTIWLILELFKEKTKTYSAFGPTIPIDYPVLGMDISHYQGEIDWNEAANMKVQNDSIAFVYIKATEGVSLRDKNKRKNAEGARSVNIDYGFYHFFIPSLSAKKQADFFCQRIGGYNFDLRPVLDIESETDLSKTALLDSVKVFLDRTEENLQLRPIIYTYANFFERYFFESTEDFWIAKYAETCPYMDFKNVICWQFTEKGTVNGISYPVDLNVAKKDFFERVRK